MEPCVTCGNVEPVVPVPTGGCECVTPGGGPLREARLLAPTRHEYEYWVANDPVIPEGVICIVKDRLFEGSREYIISNSDTDKFSDLTPMAGAPLSRTGAANHSPLAAEGKSTLDPSWLPAATSTAIGGVMTSTTGASGKVPIAANGSNALDLSWLPVSASGAANKIPVATNGNTLDPSWLPEATSTTLGGVMASTTTAANNVVKADANGGLDGWRTAISNAIADPNAGLVVGSDGKLNVDFDKMPTDKFEALLKSLKMLVPLESNLDLYVDKNHASAGDSIVNGRGTQSMPFRTIQAAVDYVTGTYAINSKSVRIRVAAGTYAENITLPVFTRTTGTITIEAVDYNNPPTVTTASTWAHVFQCIGGPWFLRRLNIEASYVIPTASINHYLSLIYSNGVGAVLDVAGCTASAVITGSNPDVFTRCNLYEASGGGTIHLAILDNYPNSFHIEKGNLNECCVFMISNSSALEVYDTNTSSDALSMTCSGNCSCFCNVFVKSSFTGVFGASYQPKFTGTMTGKKYAVSSNSGIEAPENGFPGDVAGTAEAETFAYYKERQ